jgi:hypothetical protein
MAALTPQDVLWLVAGLQLKHVLCDGPLQTTVMVERKSQYGDPRGVAHALIHGVGSALVLLLLGSGLGWALGLAAADGLVHYHTDYAKERMVRQRGWTSRHRAFWWTMAVDQGLHHFTYILMVAALLAVSG